MLAGLRHGRTIGTPLALVVRNRDHANWAWGMSPGRPRASRPVRARSRSRCPDRDTPTSRACSSSGIRTSADALERASARHTAVHVAAGAVAKALLRELGIDVGSRAVEIGGETDPEAQRAAIDAARATATRSAASSR